MSSQGYASLLGIDSSNPTTVAYEYLQESIRKTGSIVDTGGIKGTRSHPSERTRPGNFGVGGGLTMTPTPEEWAGLWPWILGTNASGTTYALAETLQSRYVQKKLRTDSSAQGTATYASMYVNRAVISSSQGSPVQLELDLIGTTETMTAGNAFPSISTAIISGPFMHYEGVLTLLSTTRSVRSMTIEINNNLQVFYNNSQSATDITPTDRTITVTAELPYTSVEQDLLNQAHAGSAGTWVLTYANYSMTFTFGTLQVPAETPVVQGKTDIPLILNMQARSLSTNKELVVTLDSTP